MAFDYIVDGIPTIPVPGKPALLVDNGGNVLYISSKSEGWVPIGGGPGGGPVIQASLQAINTSVVQTLTITAVATILYAVSIYMKAAGTGSAGHTVTATISYTAADDSSAQQVALILPLDSSNVVMETYPLLVKGGTSISLATAYGGGATHDAYTISVRLVQMPA
jgi:hypothetical protein